MPFSQPSISAFYGRTPESSSNKRKFDPSSSSDGFTNGEIEPQEWSPNREYEPSTIGDLIPGLRPVTFVGRVANFSTTPGKSKADRAAGGWHNVIVKDDTGTIALKLFFTRNPYPLKLGQLITLWTAFITDARIIKRRAQSSNNGQGHSTAFFIPDIPLSISLFPGRDINVNIMFHTRSDAGEACKKPIGYIAKQPLSGLLTVQQFTREGEEVPHCRILVCVKSIGARKTVMSKAKGVPLELLEVGVFDHTGELVLKLWGPQTASAEEWAANQTVLLIQRPSFRVFGGRGTISLASNTVVDVDPDFEDAAWLRNYAAGLLRRDSIRQDFPEDVWDVDIIRNGIYRTLFSLADVDDFVRNDPSQVFSGFLNLTIMELNLSLNHRRKMFMCTECCGLPIYMNARQAVCRNCNKPSILRVNPKAMGRLIDETGCILPGKLLWSELAWEELLGRSVEQMLSLDNVLVKDIEQALLYKRITLVFGWKEEVGRLAVLGVQT